MISFAKLANPSYFMTLSARILPWLAGISVALIVVGLPFALMAKPDERQAETVRIMFIHVPSAWLSMACYGMITISSIGSLIWRHPLADVSAKAAAPIGATFTLLALITGSLWGKPTWGAYWAWDARMTSELILLFLYLGLIAMWQSIEDQNKAGHAAAILAIVGSVNLPIIKFSVDWWATLHQGSSIKASGTTFDWHYLVPLIVMSLGFTCLLLWLHMKGMRAEILRRRVHTMMVTRVNRAVELKPAE